MKIIQISASYKPAYIYGGPIQSVAKLCEVLTDQKVSGDGLSINDVQVLTTTANGTYELEVMTDNPVLVEGVKVSYFKRWTKDHSHFSPGLLWALRRKIRQAPNARPVIHIHAWWNLVSVLGCLIAKWYHVPVVLSPRGMLTVYTQNNRNSFFKRLLHQSIGKNLLQYCHIHATSEKESQDVLSIITPKSITIIPNLVNIPHGEWDTSLKPNTSFRLIFLSRIEEKKGLELLFDALSLLDIDWLLTIAGSGKKEYVDGLKVKAQHLKLNDRINWEGQVSDLEKYPLIAGHNLLLLTSFNENFANVVIESLSVGTPVLVSDQVGLSDYVNEQQLGWVCKLDANDIKEAISKAFHDQDRSQRIRQLAPEIIRKDFDDRVLVNRYLDMYKRLV